jgi:hypothetical protein
VKLGTLKKEYGVLDAAIPGCSDKKVVKCF